MGRKCRPCRKKRLRLRQEAMIQEHCEDYRNYLVYHALTDILYKESSVTHDEYTCNVADHPKHSVELRNVGDTVDFVFDGVCEASQTLRILWENEMGEDD